MIDVDNNPLSKKEYFDEVIIPKMETIKENIRDLFKSIVYSMIGSSL